MGYADPSTACSDLSRRGGSECMNLHEMYYRFLRFVHGFFTNSPCFVAPFARFLGEQPHKHIGARDEHHTGQTQPLHQLTVEHHFRGRRRGYKQEETGPHACR
jgi:hypothetical protein